MTSKYRLNIENMFRSGVEDAVSIDLKLGSVYVGRATLPLEIQGTNCFTEIFSYSNERDETLIRLRGGNISRNHGHFTVSDSGVTYTDTSANGSCLNKKDIGQGETVSFKPEDEIIIMQYLFRLELFEK